MENKRVRNVEDKIRRSDYRLIKGTSGENGSTAVCEEMMAEKSSAHLHRLNK